MAPSPELQPGDWHDALVDLLATGRGIPEDRARRFLARHAEEVRAADPVTCHARECPCPPSCDCCPSAMAGVPQAATARPEANEEQATIARVQAVVREWEFMSGRTAARNELLAALNGPAEAQR